MPSRTHSDNGPLVEFNRRSIRQANNRVASGGSSEMIRFTKFFAGQQLTISRIGDAIGCPIDRLHLCAHPRWNLPVRLVNEKCADQKRQRGSKRPGKYSGMPVKGTAR